MLLKEYSSVAIGRLVRTRPQWIYCIHLIALLRMLYEG